MTTDLVPAGITENRPFLGLAEKCFLWPKIFFPQKTHKICLKTDIYLGKGTFLLAQLFPVVASTWLELRSGRFFGPKNSVFGPKIRFLPYDPNFGR